MTGPDCELGALDDTRADRRARAAEERREERRARRAAVRVAATPAGWLPLSGDVTIDRYGFRNGDVVCTARWEPVERLVAA